LEIARGAIVVLAAKGAYTAKPRPAVVVQSDVPLPPGDRTGLAVASQAMVDKVSSVPRTAVDRAIGACDDIHLEQIEDALRRWLDL
jgi:mRNA-degrading endonuclease toxin of MazEF toxin-antitoxin module